MASVLAFLHRHARGLISLHAAQSKMSSEQNQLAIEVIGCMVEVLADDNGNIDQKCFDKIFNSCIKAVLVGMKVGDQALASN